MIKSKLIGDFELLRDHCIKLRRNYNTYVQLYNEENRALLGEVAATFFSDVAEIMHRDWILQACKLMDPASTKRQGAVLENITVKLIDEQLEVCGSSNHKIRDLSRDLLEYGEKIKPARNKRIAHYDREHEVSNITLGITTEEELFGFLLNIQEYCDQVGIALGIGPLDFSSSGCKGDVLDLLTYLRRKRIMRSE
ncbi:AbiU2 domain-containing protein [Aurantivibrio infirmus]